MESYIKARPRVSVVIPAFNAAGTIELTIRSALQQTLKEIEIIVCDDASTDGTMRILRSIKDTRLVILKNPKNQGPGLTRDRAIEVARGEWIAVLDADDVWEDKRLESMLNATNGETDVMIFDDLMICHHSPIGLVPWRRMRGPKAFNGNGKKSVDLATELWTGSYQFLIKPLIHTKTIHKSGIRHSTLKFGEDTEFFLRLIAYGLRLRYIPHAYYWYRITPNSMSSNTRRSELINHMLESLLPLFELQPNIQKTIRVRIQYRKLLQYIKAREFLQVFRILWLNPRLFAEFTHRSIRQTVYFLHRGLHSGSPR